MHENINLHVTGNLGIPPGALSDSHVEERSFPKCGHVNPSIEEDYGPRFQPHYNHDKHQFAPSQLYVIAVISNPRRYESRYRLYTEFARHMEASGVKLYTVEHALGDRPFEVTTANNPRHLQLRGGATQELWLKESMINAGVRRLPSDWKYMAWIDADITFMNPNWAVETIQALQHHPVIQPWSHSIDLGPNAEVITNEGNNAVDRSFCSAWESGELSSDGKEFTDGYYGKTQELFVKGKAVQDRRSHCGYAWAIRREAYDGIGGFIDWMVTGSADHHMALAFAGLLNKFDPRMGPGYNRRLKEFAVRADRHIKQNLGAVKGTITHGWHGRKKQRGYISRIGVLIDAQFDPDVDITYDSQGLLTLNTDNRILRDGLRRYLSSRNEDSTDTQ